VPVFRRLAESESKIELQIGGGVVVSGQAEGTARELTSRSGKYERFFDAASISDAAAVRNCILVVC
jgi:hypothetical protein